MKKTMTILLAVFCLAAFSTVLADSAEDPILFRGIPWGTNYNEATSEFEGWEDPVPYEISFDNIIYNIASPVFGENGFTAKINPEGFKVAGFDLEDIQMYFAYPVDENGSVDKNFDNGKLCIAEYELTVEKQNTEDACMDLKNKLSHMYGDSEIFIDVLGKEMNVWHGAEGSVVTLRRGYYGNSHNSLRIIYSYEGCKEMLDSSMDMTGL